MCAGDPVSVPVLMASLRPHTSSVHVSWAAAASASWQRGRGRQRSDGGMDPRVLHLHSGPSSQPLPSWGKTKQKNHKQPREKSPTRYCTQLLWSHFDCFATICVYRHLEVCHKGLFTLYNKPLSVSLFFFFFFQFALCFNLLAGRTGPALCVWCLFRRSCHCRAAS